MENIEKLAYYIYQSAPLVKSRNIHKELIDKITSLRIEDKLELLLFSFKNFDRHYNNELCLSLPILWNDFDEKNWKLLIEEMFPRNVDIYQNKLKYLNTGLFYDIVLLNGIIGVSPFKYIFEELLIDKLERNSFYNYMKLFGEASFFLDVRELIDDIINFYDINIFHDIVTMRERLLLSTSFEQLRDFRYLIDYYSDDKM
ncbi:MAG: hypothetical protein RL662_647 [Bacteroidota bacterium]|jgi:hypothetical protein